MGSRGVFQPVGQKRLTNIAVVRLKKSGQRFEIACYKNKVQDWRNGIEKDVDEVLQTTTVFSNVSKGVLAKDKELQVAFGTTEQRAICMEILGKGELQVAEEERKILLDNTFKDVASVLVEKCINPETSRPYTLALIERALRDVHFNVDTKRSAKQQALEALPLLQAKFPIERARMRLKLTVPVDYRDELEQALTGKGEGAQQPQYESQDLHDNNYIVVTQVDPGMFRELHHFMVQTTKGRGRVEVVSFAVQAEGTNASEFAAAANTAAAPVASTSAASGGVMVLPDRETGDVQQQQQQQQQQGQHHITRPAVHRPMGAAALGSSSAQGAAAEAASTSSGGGPDVLYPRGSVAGLPEEHVSRRERFAELDTLQPGWQVELRRKGDTVEAVFFAPGTGALVGAFAMARRQALAASKAAAAAGGP